MLWGSAAEMSHGTVSISHRLAEIPACFPAVPIWTPILPTTGLGKWLTPAYVFFPNEKSICILSLGVTFGLDSGGKANFS